MEKQISRRVLRFRLISSDPDQIRAEASVSSASTNKEVKANKRVRKFDDEFIKYGFVCTEDDEPRARCVMCLTVLSNESLKPNKLHRHLHTKHPESIGKPVEFFQKKVGHLKCKQHFMTTFTDVNQKALEASYRVSYRIAKSGKPYTIAEDLIVPAVQDIAAIMFGEKEMQQISQIPLSDTTVSRRIFEMAENVENEIIMRIRKSLDSIIVSTLVQLLKEPSRSSRQDQI
ncbi:protein FAM200B-like [Onthophagus taurus]|uniref:protein FAM200B-like n=1 Tax=Onthophagus taurus TaxID=166361 RepID=UPI0039BEB9DE